MTWENSASLHLFDQYSCIFPTESQISFVGIRYAINNKPRTYEGINIANTTALKLPLGETRCIRPSYGSKAQVFPVSK